MPKTLAASFAEWFVQFFRATAPRPVLYDYFAEHEVAGYDTAMRHPSGEQDACRIDDTTWNDLDVRSYLRRMAAQASLLARQLLYFRLRTGFQDDAFTAPLLNAIQCDHRDTRVLLEATEPTRQVLRSMSYDLTTILFSNTQTDLGRWTRYLWLAPVIAMAGLGLPWSALSAWSLLTPWLIVAYLVLNGWTQIRLSRPLNLWHAQRDTLTALLQAAVQWGEAGRDGLAQGDPVLQPLTQALVNNRRLLALMSPNWIERLPMLAEYANLFALYQYSRLHGDIARMQALLPGLRTAYVQLAQAEAQICLLEHLASQSTVCVAQCVPASTVQGSVPELDLRGMVNPLLDLAQPLDMHLKGKGALVTGQNGVGKSTLLRAIGLNLLTARAFGYCYATRALVPRLPVWSSIESKDSLTASESLYMAEMRRAETLLRVAQTPGAAVFLIDEIFKGTNNAESVAAAAAVLSHLARHALVVVSTHNVVLAPLLTNQLLALHLTADACKQLNLEPGILVHTNGLRMMENYSFPHSVREVADRVHDWFATYVSKPGVAPNLL